MKSILDKTFKYIPSSSTDLAKTFARIRAEQKKKKEVNPVNVTELKPAKQPRRTYE